MMRRCTCKGCGVQFVALRSDALTCSPKCRQRYKRHCDQITADAIRSKVMGPTKSVRPCKKGGK